MAHHDYIIREYKDSDIAGILDLWEFYSGWGRPEVEEYKKWMKSPFGDCVVIVAEHNNKIVGQIVLTPTEIYIKGEKYKALKLSAPIIHADYRSGNMMAPDSLVMQVLVQAYPIIINKGFCWLYSFPAVGWARIMKIIHRFGLSPWKVSIFRCFKVLNSKPIHSGYSVKTIEGFPEETTELWNNFKRQNDNSSFLTREIEWLNYKWGDNFKAGIFDKNGKLHGYAVVKRETGQLVDFIVDDEKETTAALVQLKQLFDAEMKGCENEDTFLKLMMTPFFEKNIKEGFVQPGVHDYTFGISALKEYPEWEKLTLDDWYVFPND